MSETHRQAASTVGGLGAFTPSDPDPMLARLLSSRSGAAVLAAQPLRFTPRAGQSAPATLTVATHARSVDLRANLRVADVTRPAHQPVVMEALAPPSLSIRPSTYSLGRSVGWKAFGGPAKAAQVDRALARAAGPVGAAEPAGRPSRFGSDFTLTPGAAPRPTVDERSVQLDMSGRYRVSRSIDLKAGVRYRVDRDRLDPVVQDGPDSSAVYVGTAFRF